MAEITPRQLARLAEDHAAAKRAEVHAQERFSLALRGYVRRRGVRELSRLVGVSATTVSMFFRGNPGVLSRENALRLLRADAGISQSQPTPEKP